MFVMFAAALGAQTAGPAEKARQAGELVAAGQPEAAIPIYRALVEALPNDAGMLVNLAIAEFKAKRYQDAIGHTKAALQLQPGLPAANLFLGASYVQSGEHALAIPPLAKAVEALPEDRNARLMLAESLLEMDHLDEAVEHFRKAAKMMPASPRVWNGLGRAYDAFAGRVVQKLEAAGADSAYWHALLAETQLKQRRYGSAFASYRAALLGQPALRGIHAGLSEVYRLTGHSEWATVERDRERAMPPVDCAVTKLECDFAAGRFREVAEQAPATPETCYWAAKAYRELAREAYTRLAQLPPSSESYQHAAHAAELEGRWLDAVSEWRGAVALAPDNPEARAGLATALFREGDHSAALPLLDALLKKEPESRDLSFMYGVSLLSVERPAEAVPYLEAAIRIDGRFLPAHSALGEALLRAGEASEAIPHLKMALAGDDDGSVHFELLRAYQITRQTELAQHALLDYQEFRRDADEKKRAEEGANIAPP